MQLLTYMETGYLSTVPDTVPVAKCNFPAGVFILCSVVPSNEREVFDKSLYVTKP